MFKVRDHEAPKLMCKVFKQVNFPCNFCKNVKNFSNNITTYFYETLSHLGPIIQNLVSLEIKGSETKDEKRLTNGNQIDVRVCFEKRLF